MDATRVSVEIPPIALSARITPSDSGSPNCNYKFWRVLIDDVRPFSYALRSLSPVISRAVPCVYRHGDFPSTLAYTLHLHATRTVGLNALHRAIVRR